MMITNEKLEEFFSTALERYAILTKRRSGAPGPWTQDKVFQQYRFCNTFREDDRTTIWFRENLREPLRNDAHSVLLATVAFRWFNRIETGEKIKYMLEVGGWSSSEARVALEKQKPVVTGAYIIKTPNGMSKLDGVLWCIDQVDTHHLAGHLPHTPPEERTLEGVWDCLMQFPYLGSFMSYQIVSDLIHTCWLDKASDTYTWAAMGPGSTRGLGWLVAGNPDHFSMGSKKDCDTMRLAMQEIVAASERPWSGKWTMQQVQHWLCEHDKYTRAKNGQVMKRRFSW
jgi:hypothetical protein